MTKRDVDDVADQADKATKKLNRNFTVDEIKLSFQPKLWTEEYQQLLKHDVAESQPYRWGHFTDLFDDELLRKVRKEVLNEIHFTKKETDIYKVYQLGDLANLSGLDWNDLLRLPSLFRLRAAIYSQEFRDAISTITGCGKLSGIKTDMLINTYRKGCHLLTHDDVIGLRRVSFILYMPEPGKPWKAQYGGALRLFPLVVPNVPKTDYECKFVPQFNQMAFFTVQPGLLFHDVEEVREDRHRLLIQGWFHIPQPGEDGYIPGEQAETEARLTLQQLQLKELQEFDFPKPFRYDLLDDTVNQIATAIAEGLTEDDRRYLERFLNPLLLRPEHIATIKATFLEENIVEIPNLFNEAIAEPLKKALREAEIERETPTTVDTVEAPWKCAVPPHKQRFLYIDGKLSFSLTKESIDFENKVGPQEMPNFGLVPTPHSSDERVVAVARFVTLILFKKWLALITELITTLEQVLVRRFRPGQDFILATPTDKQLARNDEEVNAVLEATLDLTPTADTSDKLWALGEYGGYELCMARPEEFEEDDDPAIYKQSDDADDLVLLTTQCLWNRLTLMLRDPTVLKFVKYVSINARGSRWDVLCQWNVKDGGDDDDEDEDEENNDNDN